MRGRSPGELRRSRWEHEQDAVLETEEKPHKAGEKQGSVVTWKPSGKYFKEERVITLQTHGTTKVKTQIIVGLEKSSFHGVIGWPY